MAGTRLILAVLLAAALGSGCTRTFAREAVQPNPLAHPSETLRTSEVITIVTGDMELEKPQDEDAGTSGSTTNTSMTASVAHNHHYPLFNEASFTMVSRDRLRFHVQIDHKWEEYADMNTWDVKLEDNQGHHWKPESVEHVRQHIITKMWDRETRSAVCDARGRDAKGDCITLMGFQEDGWRHRQTLGNLSVYRGNGDFVFYQRDLFRPDVKWIRLTVSRSGEAFEFVWRFEDNVASE